MRTRFSFRSLSLASALTLCLLGCESPTSFKNGGEYLRSKGFDSSSFAQVENGNTVKNVNDQLPSILQAIEESGMMISKRGITPEYTIYLESGSSLPSQTISIQIGQDGYGMIQHLNKQAYFYCPKLLVATRAAFKQSSIVLR